MNKRYEILTGNDACTQGALAAGMNFYAGYPITPATEIMENCSALLPKRGGVFMQMEDELGSAAAVIGASLAGAKAMTATSGPGFSLMQENIGYGTYIETPFVVVDVMRDGPSTGTGTHPLQGDVMQAKWGRAGGNHPVITLVPNSVNELYYETIRAFNLAEELRTSVFVLSDAILAHMSEKVSLPDPAQLKLSYRKTSNKPKGRVMDAYADEDGTGIPALPIYGDGHRWCVAGLTHDDAGIPVTAKPELTQYLVDKLNRKITDNLDKIESYEEYRTEDAELIVVAIGLLSRNVKASVDTLREQGYKIGLFRPITVWPFPEKRLHELLLNKRSVLTVEMNEGMLEGVVRATAYGTPAKAFNITQSDGQIIRLEDIIAAAKEAY